MFFLLALIAVGAAFLLQKFLILIVAAIFLIIGIVLLFTAKKGSNQLK